MKRQRAPLGELCTLVKGASPISKTLPGSYPLVTTGEQHKTATDFQFDAEAVCIPLISSTGHGHASLKRVHYQSGKFALANLLAASLIKDRSVLSPKFLGRYLTFTKDRLIVPLMTGAANMSISIDRLRTVPVDYPALAEQERIVKLLDEADGLRKLRAQADRRTAALIPALFDEMFGGKKCGSLVELGSLVKFVGGGTPARAQPKFFEGRIPWATSKDMKSDYLSDTQEHITDEAIESSATNLVPAGTVLAVVKSKILLHSLPVAIAAVPLCFGQDMKGLVCDPHVVVPEFVASALRATKDSILAQARGANTEGLTLDILRSVKVPYAQLPLQKTFAQRATEIRELEAAQTASRRRLDDLFQSMLHRAFSGEL